MSNSQFLSPFSHSPVADNIDSFDPFAQANVGADWNLGSSDVWANGPAQAPGLTHPYSSTQMFLLSDSGQVSPYVLSAATKTTGGHKSSPAPAPAPTPSPAPNSTLVGAAGGLQFNLVWDASVTGASNASSIEQAAVTAATLFSQMFTNAEVVTINVGFGEINGSTIAAGNLAESESVGLYSTYASVRAGLMTDAGSSSYQAQADATLSSTDPTQGGSFFVTVAEAQALGLAGASSLDGNVGLSSAYSWDFNSPTTPVAAGQYDAVGAFEHEFTEVLGRLGSVGSRFGAGVYTPLDLFRYTGSGVRNLATGSTAAYFSVDGGATNLGTYNNPLNGGDASDWIPSLVGDSFGSGYAGHSAPVSSTDLIEVASLGYKLSSAGIAATLTPGLA